MLIIVIILTTLSATVVILNYACWIADYRNRRRGIDEHVSMVPIYSLLLGLLAWIAGGEPRRLWPFLPTLLDPATWALAWLPFFLWADSRRRRKQKS